MSQHNILVLDNNDFFYKILVKINDNTKTASLILHNQDSILDSCSSGSIVFVNTSLLVGNFQYRYQRGGFAIIKELLSTQKQSFPIFFFSIEPKPNIVKYLSKSWLKHSNNSFLHFPFEEKEILRLLETSFSPNSCLLIITHTFLDEISSNLLEKVRSIKHDYLNRISRIRPELKSFIDSRNLKVSTNSKCDFDFDHSFMNDELNLISKNISILLENSPISLSRQCKDQFMILTHKLEKLPKNLKILSIDRSKSSNNFIDLLNQIDEIGNDFEVIITSLNNRKTSNGKHEKK